MSGTYEFLRVETVEGVATLTLHRPPLNVLTGAMMAEMNAALDAVLSGGDWAAVVIRGEGRAFSAGVDVADHTADKVADMLGAFHGIFRRLAATDAVTVAAVHGAALGGGCELACFCDVVLASDDAKFGQPEVQVGVFPPVAACVLPLRVGIGKAVELVALGATIDAVEAHRIGLVNQLYTAASFETDVKGYVDGIRRLSRPVVRMAKRATVQGLRDRMLSQLASVERLYLDELMGLADAHEGIAAFMEKRRPEWVHG